MQVLWWAWGFIQSLIGRWQWPAVIPALSLLVSALGRWVFPTAYLAHMCKVTITTKRAISFLIESAWLCIDIFIIITRIAIILLTIALTLLTIISIATPVAIYITSAIPFAITIFITRARPITIPAI